MFTPFCCRTLQHTGLRLPSTPMNLELNPDSKVIFKLDFCATFAKIEQNEEREKETEL